MCQKVHGRYKTGPHFWSQIIFELGDSINKKKTTNKRDGQIISSLTFACVMFVLKIHDRRKEMANVIESPWSLVHRQ